MGIPLQLISPKFALLWSDLKNCKTDEERRKLLEDSKINGKYDGMAEEIKTFFKSKEDGKKSG